MAAPFWEPPAAKLGPPVTGTVVVERPRLLRRLDAATHGAPLTLLLGYPGAGKTVLLGRWVASRPDHHVAWLSCDESDVEPVRFWGALVAAIRRPEARLGDETLGTIELDGSVSRDSIAALTNELGSLAEPLTIVIDDLHFAGEPRLWPLLTAFVEWIPTQVRLLLSSRVEPVLPLHRWRIEGRVAEIRNDELMFAKDEVASLFEGLGVIVDNNTVAHVAQRTEGWAAGLQLAALSVRGRDDADTFLRAFAASDRNVVDYLVGEVLDRQPAATVDFLLETSVLRELDADICQALTGRIDAGALLRHIEASNLFLVTVDRAGCRYRYHHLFAQLLRNRLRAKDPSRELSLNRIAADWFTERGQLPEAVDHLVRAGEIGRAIAVLRAHVVHRYFSAPLIGSGTLVELIDDATLARDRDLALEYALAVGMDGDLDDGGRWLRRLERAVVNEGADDLYRGRLLAARGMWQMARGDAERSLMTIHEARALLDPSDDMAHQLAAVEIRSRHYQDDLDGVRRCAQEGALAVRRLQPFAAVVVASAQAGMEYDAGFLRVAEERARDALQLADDSGTRNHYAAGDGLRTLGAILLERGNLDDAEPMLEQALRLVERAQPVIELLCLVEQQSLLLARNQVVDAHETMARARLLLAHLDACDALVARVTAAEARLYLLLSAPRRAEEIAASMPAGARRTLVHARVALAYGHTERAAACLDALGSNWPRHQLESALLRARIAIALTRPEREVNDQLACALAIAEEQGFVRALLVEGPEVNDALDRALRRAPTGLYRTVLVAALRTSVPLAPPSRADQTPFELSDRERDVLRYLATRMSNREIAAELYVSLNTLKTHVKSIYRKLDATSRAEAVATGQARGFL
jgi:LuxR family maltose regulon positive regulatory protein